MVLLSHYLTKQPKMIVCYTVHLIDKQQLALHKSRQAQCAFAQADYMYIAKRLKHPYKHLYCKMTPKIRYSN